MSNFGFIFKNANPESKPSKQNNCFFLLIRWFQRNKIR